MGVSGRLLPPALAAMTLLALSGCARGTPAQTPPAQIPPSAEPAETSTSEPSTLELGQPFWIGRGTIVEAVFLPGQTQVAIAWGSGVSLTSVETGQDVWFRSTPANLIAFGVHPQAEAFAAALSDGSVMIFDASDGEARRVEAAPPNAYWGDLAWSPDGRTIALQVIGANRSDPIILLDVVSGQTDEVPESRTGEGVAPALTWSPDGSSLTLAALSGTCPRLIDIRTGEERMRLGVPEDCFPILPLVFLADGQMLAIPNQDGGLDLLRFPDGSRVRSLEGSAGRITGRLITFPAASDFLFVDPSGRWIAFRGGYDPYDWDHPDHPLIVWDLIAGHVRAQLENMSEPLARRHRLAAAFDGDSILMLYESGEITRWRFAHSHSEETVVSRVPTMPVSAQPLAWSADGSHLALTGLYGGVDVYEVADARLVRHFGYPLGSPSLSPDGNLVALYDPDENAENIYQVTTGRLLHTVPASPVLMGAAFSPDGRYLAYGAGAGVHVSELASGTVMVLESSSATTAAMNVTRLIWSPDGRALVIARSSGTPGDSEGPGSVVLWKRGPDGLFEAIYQVANVLAGYTSSNLVLAAFNPSGTRVALQSLPEAEAGLMRLVVYDLGAGGPIQTYQEYRLATWANDTELLAAEAQYDVRMTRFDVVRGESTVGNARDMGGNAYAPGGIFIAQTADPPERGVLIRHWQTGDFVTWGQHEALGLYDYGWSPDGRWLVSMGNDGTIRVWPVLIR